MSVRGDIETAIVDLLCPLLSEGRGGKRGGYLMSLGVYAGSPTPGENDQELIHAMKGGAPAVLVSTGSAAFDEESMSSRRRFISSTMAIELLAISQISRSAEAKHRGDGGDPGLYQILEDVRALLLGMPLDIEGCVSGLIPGVEEPVLRSSAMHVWRLTYTVVHNIKEDALDAQLRDLLGFDFDINEADDSEQPGGVNPVVEGALTVGT